MTKKTISVKSIRKSSSHKGKPIKSSKGSVDPLSKTSSPKPLKKASPPSLLDIRIKKNEVKDKKIKKLMSLLNSPETGCFFWNGFVMGSDIMGVRPIERTTKTIINEHGFNPLEQLKKEIFHSVYFIQILDGKITVKEQKFLNQYNKELENTGIIYLMHHDITWIYDFIRNRA